jgi:hypothetical protein
LLGEWGFLPASLTGLVWFWMRRPQKRPELIWPLLYAILLSPILLYRGTWHYFFIHLAIASVMFSFFLSHLLSRWRKSWVEAPSALYRLGLCVLVVHASALGLVINSKMADARDYQREVGKYLKALSMLHYGERVAAMTKKPPPMYHLHGTSGHWTPGATEFHRAFSDFFVFTTEPMTQAWLTSNRVGAIVQSRKGIWTNVVRIEERAD